METRPTRGTGGGVKAARRPPVRRPRHRGVAQRAQVAVRIPDGHGGDARGPPRHPEGVVADRLALRHVAELQHARGEAQHRAHGVRRARGGVDAVERRPRPRQVGAEPRPQEHAGRVGERARRRRQPVAGGGEAAALALVERVGRHLRRDQVRHHEAQVDAAQPLGLRAQPVELRRRPGPGGSCRCPRAAWPAAAGPAGAPRAAHASISRELPQHRQDPRLRERPRLAGPQPVQHRQRGAGQQRPQRQRLLRVRHEEVAAPLGEQARADARRPQAVGVRLEHRRDGGAGAPRTAAASWTRSRPGRSPGGRVGRAWGECRGAAAGRQGPSGFAGGGECVCPLRQRDGASRRGPELAAGRGLDGGAAGRGHPLTVERQLAASGYCAGTVALQSSGNGGARGGAAAA